MHAPFKLHDYLKKKSQKLWKRKKLCRQRCSCNSSAHTYVLHFGRSACSSLCVIWQQRAKNSPRDGVTNARAQFSNSCPPLFGFGVFALMQSGVKRKQKRERDEDTPVSKWLFLLQKLQIVKDMRSKIRSFFFQKVAAGCGSESHPVYKHPCRTTSTFSVMRIHPKVYLKGIWWWLETH